MHPPSSLKFRPPQKPAGHLARGRLVEKLDAAVEHPLTLIAAPAGSGKSAALAQWNDQRVRDWPVAWLSVDPDDADRRRFWAGVVATMRDAGIDTVTHLRAPPAEAIDALLPEFIEAIEALPQPAILVLDDLHEIEDGAVLVDLRRLLRLPPRNLRLVIATRTDPAFALDRLRLAGDLVDIRAPDLAFTPGEAECLFETLGVSISREDLAALLRRTEGWAAGLRLAGTALQEHANPTRFIAEFAGDDGAVADYLLSEVLARELPEVRDFMMCASILAVLTPELAVHVTGRPDSALLLEELYRRHAFVSPVDSRRGVYVLHPLLAELLRTRLVYERPGLVPELHERAARWLAEHGDHVAALTHATAGGHYDLAAEIAADHWLTFAVRGELRALRRALEPLDHDVLTAEPALMLALSCALINTGEPERGHRYLDAASIPESGLSGERRGHLEAMRAATTLYLARSVGDLDEAHAAAHRLIELAAPLEFPAVDGGEAELRAFAHTSVGIASLWGGDFTTARQELDRGLASAREAENDWLIFTSLAYAALVAARMSFLSVAERRARDALDLAELRGWSRTIPAGTALTTLGSIALLRNELDAARTAFDRAVLALRPGAESPLRAICQVERGRTFMSLGEFDAAVDSLNAGLDDLGDWPQLPTLAGMLEAQLGLAEAALGDAVAARERVERAHSTTPTGETANALAQFMLAADDPDGARVCIGPTLRDEVPAVPSTVIEAWALEAVANDQLADHAAATAALEHALDQVEPVGYRRPLMVHRAALRPILHRHLTSGTAHRSLVEELLREFDATNGRRTPPPLLVDALSERERAVLRYLPTMMSNQEIAGELFVSVNTVKTHLRAIYRKLDATDRRQAVRRARELELLTK